MLQRLRKKAKLQESGTMGIFHTIQITEMIKLKVQNITHNSVIIKGECTKKKNCN